MKEYEILCDAGEARKLVEETNRLAKEGWLAKAMGGTGDAFRSHSVYVLMERSQLGFSQTMIVLFVYNALAIFQYAHRFL